MHLDYSDHARDGMSEHNISEEEVERTLSRPYFTDVSRSTGNEIYFGRPKGRKIAVVVTPGSHPPRIVTIWEGD